jgi:hypothetical protein
MSKVARQITHLAFSDPVEGPVRFLNSTGGSLTRGTLLYEVTMDPSTGLIVAGKADADAAGKQATWVCLTASVANGAQGVMGKFAKVTGQNTNGVTTAGDPVYLSTTAGGFTATAPSASNAITQVVGYATVKHASAGVIEYRLPPAPIKTGSNENQAQTLTGADVANLADAAVIGGIPVIHTIAIADASADTDVVLTHKETIVDFWFLNTGIAAHASSDTIQLKNGSNAISDAVAKTATVNAIKRAATMNPTYTTIAAGGTLRITAVKNTNAAVTAYVLAFRAA